CIGTVCPSLTLISFSTPAEGDGISASTLSVEISNKGSSRSTLSPGFLSHLVIVPSKMLSPICGMTTSVAMDVSSLLRAAISSRKSSPSTVHSPRNTRSSHRCAGRFWLSTFNCRLSTFSNTSPIPSPHQRLSSHSAKNTLPAAANTAPAYPAPSHASAARPNRQTPFRKESPQFLQRFPPSWYPRAPPNTCSSCAPTAKSSLRPAAAAFADRSLPPQSPLSPARLPLPATYASSPHTK